jgi:thiol:disulfide interchange protein DsbD
MVFAASFFGAFEITMPSKLVNKSDAGAEKGGLVGIFFMALTLVLVSFSCTGPIVGTVLISSASGGNAWMPIFTMAAFAIAFALPFTLLAWFPSLLKNMPKSGGWLNSVKVVLGFVEIALGLKFLMTADQTYHWGLLDREVYLAIWIVVFTMLGFYLLGKLRFAHDDEVNHVSVKRLAMAIAVFSFVVYLIPGMWGAPLSKLSGYLPPQTSLDFDLTRNQGVVVEQQQQSNTGVKYGDVLHLPHGLQGFFDLAEAEAYAAKVDKPVFIDFTGHGCVNCREMEARVWSDPAVLELLKNEYVICALYTDDKMVLPESEWVTADNGKTLKSLGKVNAYYALTRFGVNAQPYYVLQGKNEKILAEPRGYNLDAQAFVEFLRKGVEEYRK